MRLAASASLFLLLVGPTSTPRTGTPSIPDADRSRIAEAFRVADGVGDRIWPGWHAVPFAILLITDSTEFLIHHPHPTSDFTPAGTDPALGPIWVRPRRLPVTLLATAPFVGGIPTIAVGRAEAVGQSSVEWVLTLLHEHFHQLQYGQPGYYAAVAALGLAHGDSTGMWMLNYPFPYDSVPVVRAIDSLAAALVTVLDAARPGADAPAP
ncbi:MAG TPA: hypothetical protein VFU45_05530, partial [Gemmatimonadales bacterium]|nr:hypothetical protein [Gemmatimonadales bacterium]